MKGLLSVSFGTSYADTRAKTIDVIDAQLAAAFPDRAFYTAWTSSRIIAKVLAECGEQHDSLEEAFARLSADGVDDLVVATTCLMRGHEMRKIAAAAESWAAGARRTLRLSEPLMASRDDHCALAAAIAEEFSGVSADTAVLLMGHGSPHGSNQLFFDVQAELDALAANRFFVATVEGAPTLDEIIPAIGATGATRVVTAPLMVVAGDHARNDLAGDDDGSWANRLVARGFEVEAVMKGLGEYPAMRRLVVDHARAAREL